MLTWSRGGAEIKRETPLIHDRWSSVLFDLLIHWLKNTFNLQDAQQMALLALSFVAAGVGPRSTKTPRKPINSSFLPAVGVHTYYKLHWCITGGASASKYGEQNGLNQRPLSNFILFYWAFNWTSGWQKKIRKSFPLVDCCKVEIIQFIAFLMTPMPLIAYPRSCKIMHTFSFSFSSLLG